MKKVGTTVLSLVAVALLAGSAHAQQWGTLQGQIIWGGAKVPDRKPLNVDKDQENCLRNGKILDEVFVVDPKTKGIRSVMVWISADNGSGEADFKAKLPTHESYKKNADKPVVLDQPCCMFVPQVVGVVQGQTVIAKNSDKVPHNTNFQGGVANPNINFILPPGSEKEVKDWKASTTAVPISCNIHPWMKSYARVFTHPYFVVTGEDGKFELKNVPAGKYRLIAWQPEAGYLLGKKDKHGVEIKIMGEKTTTVPEVKVMPADDKK